MAAKNIRLTRGDSDNTTTLYLTDHTTGLPVDLSDVTTMALKLRPKGGQTLPLHTLLPVVIDLPTLGKVLVTWSAAFQLEPAGWYEGELEITQTGPIVTTVWKHLRILLQEQF
jgi:hypothetical protein